MWCQLHCERAVETKRNGLIISVRGCVSVGMCVCVRVRECVRAFVCVCANWHIMGRAQKGLLTAFRCGQE